MWEHTLDKHGGTRSDGDGQVDYTMVVHRTDRDPMRRIVREAVRIFTLINDILCVLVHGKKII